MYDHDKRKVKHVKKPAAPLTLLLQHMDQVDQVLRDGLDLEPAPLQSDKPLSPETESRLGTLQAMYQDQEDRLLPLPWLRRVVGWPARQAQKEAIDKNRQRIQASTRRLRLLGQLMFVAHGWLLVGMGWAGWHFSRLTSILVNAKEGSRERLRALAELDFLNQHPNFIPLSILLFFIVPLIWVGGCAAIARQTKAQGDSAERALWRLMDEA